MFALGMKRDIYAEASWDDGAVIQSVEKSFVLNLWGNKDSEAKADRVLADTQRKFSGVFLQRLQNGQGTSCANSSSDAQEQSRYPHEFRYTTIRAVTPEERGDKTNQGDSNGGDVFMSSSPPSASPRSIQRESPRIRARDVITKAVFNGSGASSPPSKDTTTKERTRNLEERIRDRSPTARKAKYRPRIGSVHTTDYAPYSQNEEMITSVGYPSIVSPAQMSAVQPSYSTRPRMFNAPKRTGSPLARLSPRDDVLASPIATSDANRILQLMRTTCGKMHGNLEFRLGQSGSWYSSKCYIDDESGSLMYDSDYDRAVFKTLIPDLRGCQVRTLLETEHRTAYLAISTHTSFLEVYLRPDGPDAFDSWLAALLCWHPIRPKGAQNKMTKPQVPVIAERRHGERRKNSDTSKVKKSAVIKVGKMMLRERGSRSDISIPTDVISSTQKFKRLVPQSWRNVSCVLQENGEFKLYTEADVALVSVIQLSQLSRCAIQQLDPSVFEEDFCIAIYPQYTSTSTALSLIYPIYIALESRVLFEVWFVLLRAFTIPELYGPKQIQEHEESQTSQSVLGALATPTTDMFRVERSLSLRIVEAKFRHPDPFAASRPAASAAAESDMNVGNYYSEVLLDGEVRARTMLKSNTDNPFWREDYEFLDLPAVLSSTSIIMRKREPDLTERGTRPRGANHAVPEASTSAVSVCDIGDTNPDIICGKVVIHLDDLDRGKEIERWWPILDVYDETVGEIYLKIRAEELVVLMCRDYQPMSELLSKFSSGLTVQVAQMLSSELRRLSEILLNIFQVSGQASEWIMALVEDEIDGIQKGSSPVTRLRFSRRLGSNDSYESAGEREIFLRDLGKSATVEANLLFRGNSLLTKSLDLHMKRLGKEYLEETLIERIRAIEESDPDCEVDPNRVQSSDDRERNFRKLISLTKGIWKSISSSASRCPAELRMILRHIRACAEDRYGDFLRTVSYSSVSGFLFLRFFCPAVLNPKLFGLLKDHPRPKAQRTLTLIAKSLQGLANMTSFGSKESWMEPMNQFLSGHRQEFKDFIDSICSISSDRASSTIPPSYATPITILARLPPTSREGFPSLPYLIDHARNFAALVNLWLEASASTRLTTSIEGDLLSFHELCIDLQQRTKDCLTKAEQAEKPSSHLSLKWEELVEQLENSQITPNATSTKQNHTESTPKTYAPANRASLFFAANNASTTVPSSSSANGTSPTTPPGSSSGTVATDRIRHHHQQQQRIYPDTEEESNLSKSSSLYSLTLNDLGDLSQQLGSQSLAHSQGQGQSQAMGGGTPSRDGSGSNKHKFSDFVGGFRRKGRERDGSRSREEKRGDGDKESERRAREHDEGGWV
ncbi:MAG: hypothetical protein M1827_004225 [Pycnora praestabilis]|nr:MAG: hypothetical protein M1827_004225 [Pycnora praestabilis]